MAPTDLGRHPAVPGARIALTRVAPATYELRTDEGPVGRLSLDGAHGTLVTARGRTELRRGGMLDRIEARSHGAGPPTLHGRLFRGGGPLHTAGGERLRWRGGRRFGPRHRLIDAAGRPVVELCPAPRGTDVRAVLELHEGVRGRTDVEELVAVALLSWVARYSRREETGDAPATAWADDDDDAWDGGGDGGGGDGDGGDGGGGGGGGGE